MLITDERIKNIPPLYGTENIPTKDKIVRIKFFTPDSSWTWYAVEYDKDEKIFFGFVNGYYPEWGYFSLQELEQIRGQLGLPVEIDKYFKEQPFGQIKELQ